MNWPSIFLGCFVVGFVLSTLSFALAAVHIHLDVDVPFVHHPHVGAPSLDGHPVHGHGHHAAGPINFPTTMAFLAWFGGTGYLLTSRFFWLTVPALAVSTMAGLAGAAIVFWIMARVLWSPHENMVSGDYRMVGVLGRLSQPIRANGIGELIYTQAGARKSCAARSANGQAIEKGTEVVVTAYERGIAYVSGWDEMTTRNS